MEARVIQRCKGLNEARVTKWDKERVDGRRGGMGVV